MTGKSNSRLDVDPGQHPIAADVCVDDGLTAIVLKLFRQVGDVMLGELAPTIGGDLAILGIEANDDVARKRATRIMQKARVFDGSRANDHVGNAVVEVAFDRVEVTNAPANLNRDLVTDGVDDGLDDGLVFWLAGDCTVQVNQMQATGTLFEPGCCHGNRVFGKDRGIVHVALSKSDTASVFEVNRGYEQHVYLVSNESWEMGQQHPQAEPARLIIASSLQNCDKDANHGLRFSQDGTGQQRCFQRQQHR